MISRQHTRATTAAARRIPSVPRRRRRPSPAGARRAERQSRTRLRSAPGTAPSGGGCRSGPGPERMSVIRLPGWRGRALWHEGEQGYDDLDGPPERDPAAAGPFRHARPFPGRPIVARAGTYTIIRPIPAGLALHVGGLSRVLVLPSAGAGGVRRLGLRPGALRDLGRGPFEIGYPPLDRCQQPGAADGDAGYADGTADAEQRAADDQVL